MIAPSLRTLAAGYIAFGLAIGGFAQEPTDPPKEAGKPRNAAQQQMLEFSVRVIDPTGNPVADVPVTPWGLRCPFNHDLWRDDDAEIGHAPAIATTDARGIATIRYPLYRYPSRKARTTGVSLRVDHPDFVYVGDFEVKTPVNAAETPVIPLVRGATVDLLPRIDGKPAAEFDTLFAFWSDGRSWRPNQRPQIQENGALRLPRLAPGPHSVLLVRLEGDRATHFSAITDFDITDQLDQTLEIPLHPSVRIGGMLSSDVPRPIRRGRISFRTIPPDGARPGRVHWSGWTTIEPDGGFVIDGWPAGEPIQLAALCDGYIAESGAPLPTTKEGPDLEGGPPGAFLAAQAFETTRNEPIEIRMTPLARVVASVRDQRGKAVSGVSVTFWPNVSWWNGSSELYGSSLVSGPRLLREREFQKAEESGFRRPFESETDAEGRATIEIPAGQQLYTISTDEHEWLSWETSGSAEASIEPGATNEVKIRLRVPQGQTKTK